MRHEPKKAVLKARPEREYQLAVWQRARALFLRSNLSGRAFYWNEMARTFEEYGECISLEDDPHYVFDYSVDGEQRSIRDFIKCFNTRKFGDSIFRIFEAYVLLKTPKFETMVNAQDNLNKMGEIVGYFLRDPQVEEFSYMLAQAGQKLLHFFSYDNVDTLGTYDETTRYICLFAGDTTDYLFALDFAFIEQDIAPLHDEQLRLYYGFCAPGEDFSPVVMRSHCLSERLAGLIYSKSSLIDLHTAALRGLTFEVFTTDKSFHGLQILDRKPPASGRDDAVRKAMQLAKGIKIGRDLSAIEHGSKEYQMLNRRVKQFIIDFLA